MQHETGATVATDSALVEYQKADFRGFIFVLHEEYGLLLLRCTRKKNKPPHWQLPGGHVDEKEFLDAAKERFDRANQLLLACKNGAVRELFEETGIDVRSQSDRVVPARLRTETKIKQGTALLPNEYKHRLFFFLTVTDDDFAKDGVFPTVAHWQFKHVKLRLSVEHSGFTFEQNPVKAAEMLSYHSGGKPSEALLLVMHGESTMKVNAAKEPFEDTAVIPTPIAQAEISPKRRAKHDKDPPIIAREPVDLLPPPKEKKSMFCCFGEPNQS